MNKNETITKALHVGRREVIETYTSQEEILRVYKETKSMRQTAKQLKLALRTVFKYINRANASNPIGGLPAEDPLEHTNNREIAKALDALDQPLPRSAAEIHKLLKGSFNLTAVHYFLATRKKAAIEILNRQGNLLDRTHAILRDIYGRQIQVASFAQYELAVDRYNLNVTIEATLKFGGKVICRMSFDHYKKLFEEASDNPE